MPQFVEDARPKRPQHDPHYLETVYACGQRREHLVRIPRANWPPRPNPSVNDRPYLVARCERCGANCIVYDPVPADMTVILTGDAAAAEGRVILEPGPVLDERQVVGTGGQVLEERPRPEPDDEPTPDPEPDPDSEGAQRRHRRLR